MNLPSVIPATIINRSSCTWLEGTCSIEKLLRINLFLDTSSMAMERTLQFHFFSINLETPEALKIENGTHQIRTQTGPSLLVSSNKLHRFLGM
jgi:hypothetical protein